MRLTRSDALIAYIQAPNDPNTNTLLPRCGLTPRPQFNPRYRKTNRSTNTINKKRPPLPGPTSTTPLPPVHRKTLLAQRLRRTRRTRTHLQSRLRGSIPPFPCRPRGGIGPRLRTGGNPDCIQHRQHFRPLPMGPGTPPYRARSRPFLRYVLHYENPSMVHLPKRLARLSLQPGKVALAIPSRLSTLLRRQSD